MLSQDKGWGCGVNVSPCCGENTRSVWVVELKCYKLYCLSCGNWVSRSKTRVSKCCEAEVYDLLTTSGLDECCAACRKPCDISPQIHPDKWSQLSESEKAHILEGLDDYIEGRCEEFATIGDLIADLHSQGELR